jgi:hypothetical protein
MSLKTGVAVPPSARGSTGGWIAGIDAHEASPVRCVRRARLRRALRVAFCERSVTSRICAIIENSALSSTFDRPCSRRRAIAALCSHSVTAGCDIVRYGTST